MINKIHLFKLIFYIYLFFLNTEIYYGKVITIRNNDENFRHFINIFKYLQNDKNGLIIKFEYMEYDMTEMEYIVDINVINDITFIGNSKGTIFNFKNERKGIFSFTLSPNNFNSTIIFENIIFDNVGSDIVKNYLDDNYSSKPYYINLDTPLNNNNNIINTMSGDRFPLSFTLYEIHNRVIDNTKFYSSLILKIMLIPKNNEKHNENDKYNDYNKIKEIHLINNIGSFTYGNIIFYIIKYIYI